MQVEFANVKAADESKKISLETNQNHCKLARYFSEDIL